MIFNPYAALQATQVIDMESSLIDLAESWPDAIYDVLKAHDVKHCVYVPDAGHTRLIDKMIEDPRVQTTLLTTEQEGIAYLSGAWLAGEFGVLLMQSSGVGNCINTLSLTESYRFPLLMIITMRGEWGEFNPMQVPMAKATAQSLQLMAVSTYRVDCVQDLAETVAAGAEFAVHSNQSVAILISQRLIGRKKWTR